jgi:hypothetical protein
MFILSLIGYFMIILLLMSMMAKARPKVKDPIPGKKLKSLPMGFVSRFQMQRCSLLALLMGIVFGVSTGWLSLSTAGLIGSIAVITILLPTHYTFTTQGVGLGDGMFYPWNDFSGFTAKEKSLELTHPSIFGRLTLFVKPAEMTNVLQYVERYVKKIN